jgi:hypothetical protein
LCVDWGETSQLWKIGFVFWIHRAVLWHEQAFLCVDN